MNELQELETQMKVVSELSAAVKDLLASEHNEAAGVLVVRLLNHVESAEKLLQEYKAKQSIVVPVAVNDVPIQTDTPIQVDA